jgi:ABC-2 type transport system ATP-binding protein
MDETAVLATRGLTKAFGRSVAVDDLSVDVLPGRVTGFLGPNGAGKTTTLRMILGLARPTAGSATVLGQTYADLDHPWQRVGVTLDAASFHPRRSARNHLRWMATSARVPQERIEEVLALVNLTEVADQRVGRYSLGMRQRLGLAAALLGEPELLILDEPANGLDPAGIRWLREFLRSFAESGGAAFVSSHLLGEVAQMADEVVVLRQGRLVTHTPVSALTQGTAHAVRVRSPQAQHLAEALVSAGARVRSRAHGALLVLGMGPERVGAIASDAGVVLHELVGEGHSLEDVFFALTGEETEHARVG